MFRQIKRFCLPFSAARPHPYLPTFLMRTPLHFRNVDGSSNKVTMESVRRQTLRFICFLAIVPASFGAEQESTVRTPRVSLSNGDVIEGFHVSTASGAAGRVFLGIPYAQPPIGPLRFKKPTPLDSSANGNYSCLTYKSSCWQNHSHVKEPVTDLSEDCLYLNVFAGYACREGSNCPVLYYIHGGAFEFDTPSMFPVEVLVENFATHGLVLITVAYRLGVMGFWSLGSQEATGNYALYDVIEGLRWVQKEIVAFGGDKNRVTIMGHSSGATVVSLLALTSQTEGLFKAAVMMSGTPVLSRDLTPYHHLAEDLGCARKLDWHSDHKYDKQIVECMQRVPIELLINTYRGYEDAGSASHTTPLEDGPNGLFPAPMADLMKQRRPVDAMIGTTKNEIGFQKFSDVNATASTIADLCKSLIEESAVTRNKHLLIFQCQQHYVNGALDDMKDRNQSQSDEIPQFSAWTEKTAELRNDVQYFAPTFREAASLANAGGKVYLYSFDYEKRGLEGISPWHAFDLTYVTGIHPFLFDDRDYAIKSIYVPLFANFAKFGNPTPNQTPEPGKWVPLVTPPMNMDYLSIDLPQATMKAGYHYQGVLFWDYVVPSVGILKNPGGPKFIGLLAGGQQRKANGTIQSDGEIDWQSAFWITLLVIVLIFAILGITALVLCMKRRAWRCWACHSCLKRNKDRENETLLAYMKHADSYATFY